jgi:hypothetical protein
MGAPRRRLDAARQRREEQEDHRARPGQAVKHPDRECLLRGAHVHVRVGAPTAQPQVPSAGMAAGVAVRMRPCAIVAAQPLQGDPKGQQEDHDADRLLGAALEPRGQLGLEEDKRQPNRQ